MTGLINLFAVSASASSSIRERTVSCLSYPPFAFILLISPYRGFDCVVHELRTLPRSAEEDDVREVVFSGGLSRFVSPGTRG